MNMTKRIRKPKSITNFKLKEVFLFAIRNLKFVITKKQPIQKLTASHGLSQEKTS